MLLHLMTGVHKNILDGNRQTALYGRLIAELAEQDERFGNFVRDLIDIALQSDQFTTELAG